MSIAPYWAPFVPTLCGSGISDNDMSVVVGSSIPGPSGPPGPPGPSGPQGPAGVSVTDAVVEQNPGNLIITLSDGTHIDAGYVIGPTGAEGISGYSGFSGAAGGESGYSGISGYSGYSGSKGSKGEKGDKGDPGTSCTQNTILVDKDYEVQENDYYIGVNSKKPTTITLPTTVDTCVTKIIKAEMDAPMGNRKVTITTSDGSLIDDSDSVILQSPFETITVVYRGGNWHIVSHF